MIGLWRGRLFWSVATGLAFFGCKGGAISATGASTDDMRSDGKVTITLVPKRTQSAGPFALPICGNKFLRAALKGREIQ